MDMYNAFLQGDLEEEVYMHLPQGFSHSAKTQVCRLHKSLYGHKQASRQWNIKLTTALLQSGFKKSHLNYSLFTKHINRRIVIILVYVDDLLITGDGDVLISDTKATLHQNFKIKDLGELKYFLGIEFARSKEGILLHQRKYSLALISDVGLAGEKPAGPPVEVNQKLTTSEFDHQFGLTNDTLLADPGAYQRLIGRLLYLTITRPDISFAVQYLSQFMHAPKTSHFEAALRVIRYMKKTHGLGILMSSIASNKL